MAINLCKLAFFIFLNAFLFSSCHLQKRLYTKGFYAGKNHSLKTPGKQTTTDTLSSIVSTIHPIETKETSLTLSAELHQLAGKNKPARLKTIILGDACDTIVLKNGARLLGKVEEINRGTVIFKSCDSPANPKSTLSKKDVNYILFSNGYKEIIEASYEPAYKQSSNKTNSFSIAGFVISMVNIPLSLLFSIIALISTLAGVNELTYLSLAIPIALAVMATIFCIVALVQINRSKNDQAGTIYAIVGLALSVLFLILLLALLFSLHI